MKLRQSRDNTIQDLLDEGESTIKTAMDGCEGNRRNAMPMETRLDQIDWQSMIEMPFHSKISSWRASEVARTPVVSIRLSQKAIKTSSFYFAVDESDAVGSKKHEDGTSNSELGGFASLFDSSANNASTSLNSTETGGGESVGDADSKRSQSRTRLQPPSDVVRLEDRLLYLLQPPLESLLSGKTMEFPFQPFCFQYAGVAFMFPRHQAILADEMGLGKTMQCITTIRMLLRTKTLNSILLICPKPLVTNWQREFALWAPEVPVTTVSGNQSSRAWHWRQGGAGVKLANYELMVRDQAYVNDPDVNFDLVVLDEAQRVKNKSGATSQVIRRINRGRSWALTGTPIENSIEDLVGICEFVSPGLVASGMTPRQVRREVKDLILRRTKDVVMKDMPPRLLRDAELGLSPEQGDTYLSAENEGVVRLNELGAEINIKHVFELVLRLKQICNFDPMTGASSKMERLRADLEEVAGSGQKAIVFSQWVNTLKQISDGISEHNPLEYHGRIPSKQRDPILQEFKENPDRHVLLMSYGAGSVGLNLQFCRYVFLFDRWWNPAVEDQAINRAHRIGAAGSVTVTRMIMAGTIEQRIHEILEDKRQLFREILSDSDRPSRQGLTRSEIFGLFNLRTPQGTISQPKDEPKRRGNNQRRSA